MEDNKRRSLHVEISRFGSDSLFPSADITPELTQFIRASEKSALKCYQQSLNSFYTQGVTQNRQILLKNITQEWQMFVCSSFKDCYKMIISVANTLLMNDIEIVYWSLLLKIRPESIKPALYAYFTGYLAKSSLNSDVFPFECCLNSMIPNFRLHFTNWQLVSDFSNEISTRELASRYKQLIKPINKPLKDYEFLVKELMQVPKRKESLVSEGMGSEISLEDFNETKLEEFEIDLLIEAKQSPIDKFED